MVVFTCSHCGESVQKPKVEKHYSTKCRNNYPDLCCMDCLKDFRGDEFNSHTKCVSEAERYGGKGFTPKPNQNKGEKKQNIWLDMIQSVVTENSNVSKSVKFLLERISKQPNTPRKESKFYNFVKSLDRNASPAEIELIWRLISPKLQKLKSSQDQNTKILDDDVSNVDKKENSLNNVSDFQSEVDVVKTKKNKKEKENSADSTANNMNNGVTNDKIDENLDSTNNELADGTIEVDEQIPKKDKKKKKQKAVNAPENDTIVEEQQDSVETPNLDNDLEKPLSKKERKQNKKKQKYDAELNEIENKHKSKTMDIEFTNKKSKKRKLDSQTNEVTNNITENEPAVKKLKKHKQNTDLDIVENGNPNRTDENNSIAMTGSEFDLTNSILAVLKAKNSEIAVKKLQKKVLTEYCVVNNVNEVPDRIMKKFTKCLKKIPNLKIVQEKAMLCDEM